MGSVILSFTSNKAMLFHRFGFFSQKVLDSRLRDIIPFDSLNTYA